MKYIPEQASGEPCVADPLAGVCLSTRNRERAQASLRKADMLTNNVIRVAADMGAAVAWIDRRGAELKRRIRAIVAKPAQN